MKETDKMSMEKKSNRVEEDSREDLKPRNDLALESREENREAEMQTARKTILEYEGRRVYSK